MKPYITVGVCSSSPAALFNLMAFAKSSLLPGEEAVIEKFTMTKYVDVPQGHFGYLSTFKTESSIVING